MSAHIIVVGNEKGGSGKTTTAIHVAVYFSMMGYRVHALDLDHRQASFGQFLIHRRRVIAQKAIDLPTPDFRQLRPSADADGYMRAFEEEERAHELMSRISDAYDVIVIDTPGFDGGLSRLAHSYANTLITPLNDSFIDIGVLARIRQEDMSVIGPSHYGAMVLKQTGARGRLRLTEDFEWLVMRNRISTLFTQNKRQVTTALNAAARHFGFKVVAGFSERVIYRDLYMQGLSVMDLPLLNTPRGLSPSERNAIDEVTRLFTEISL
ncbi:division plane positioning ATPase MipZ [Varunaivibrio sulfuroxidans]|uniref:Chromosome partitioning protein n=1 Tax=Varunaivibrio sulfuroxidans TaxID=1773489 RepID=A0A4R3JAA4_9PROT|nr:division plane positioning ATPase MipZ [Varunaivibrio sulfuroxidans]TCS62542.1 chromosome partitioning protein [Varunaivibrio sulfuroxidans]WES30788.1 division plane positioning ATPase MipZ [Varunaivibrio sulfuroxidans]